MIYLYFCQKLSFPMIANCSVLISLGMVYEGLGGSTKASVASSLGFPEDEQRFREGFKVFY